jgi:hypothetical protein
MSPTIRFLAPAVLLLAAGCGIHPGAAAVVDGTEISLAHVDALAPRWCRALASTGAPKLSTSAARRQVLLDLIVLEVAQGEARRKKVPRPLGIPDTYVGVVGTLQELVNALGRDDVFAALKRADIDVDPRFGIDRTGTLVGVTGSISAGGLPANTDFSDPAAVPGEKPCG